MVRDIIGPNIKSHSACSVLKAPQESKDNRDLKIRYEEVQLRRHDVKRELKQQRKRRLRKNHLKSEFALLQNFIALIPTRPIRQMLANFSGAEF